MNVVPVPSPAPRDALPPFENISDPVHLTASATVKSGSAQGVNAMALANPLRRPMELLEFKFAMRTPYIGSVQPQPIGGAMECSLVLKKIEDLEKEAAPAVVLTNGFVPFWSFGRSLDLGAEQIYTASLANYNEFNWRLARPFYVPPDYVVVPKFHHRGYIAQDITGRFSAAGRTLRPGAKVPSHIDVPYAASYVSKTFQPAINSTADSDNSRETDLVNPFSQPLNLQRFTGRVGGTNLVAGGAGTPAIAYTETSTPAIELASKLLQLRMVDSMGHEIVRNWTRFRMVFDGHTRSWELPEGVMLEPKQNVNVFLRLNAWTGAAQPTTQAQAFVGMVGWRRIERSSL